MANQIIEMLLNNEGGFVDNPRDPGGPTNFGITQDTLSSWLGRPATIDDVKNLTRDTAAQIYEARYVAPLADYSDRSWFNLAVDAGVNHGVATVKQWIAQLIGITVSDTAMYVGLCIKRLKLYAELCYNHPDELEFIIGWTNRVCTFLGELK